MNNFIQNHEIILENILKLNVKFDFIQKKLSLRRLSQRRTTNSYALYLLRQLQTQWSNPRKVAQQSTRSNRRLSK